MTAKSILGLAGFAVVALLVLLGWRGRVDTWAREEATADETTGVRDRDYTEPAQFGDSFAPVSAFFSAMAMIATVWALHEQAKTNTAQMHALREQRADADEQAKHQRDAATAQATAFAQAVAHLAAQHEAVRDQVKQQIDANKLANIAARLHAFDQLAHLDRLGREAIERSRTAARQFVAGQRPPQLDEGPLELWNQLAQAKRDGSLKTLAWHNQLVTDEVEGLLSQRNVVSQMIKMLTQLPEADA